MVATTAWVGATKTATVDSAFNPILDGTSKIATISRLPKLFHTILAYGAAVRLKASAQEDTRQVAALYNDRMEDFEDFVEKARTYAQRSVVPFDADDGI